MLCLILASCASHPRSLYTGTLQPGAGTCDPPATATLEIKNGAILFIPHDGTLILRGSSGTDKALHAEATLAGADKKPYRLSFTGAVAQDGSVEGRYTTPRCAYVMTLHKKAG